MREKNPGPKDGAARTREWRARKKQEGRKPVQYMLTDEEREKVDSLVEALLKDGAARTREWRARKKQEGRKPVQYMLTDEEREKVDSLVEALLNEQR